MSRITIKDIAKLLQVNPSTVSRALKDHPDIGDAMTKKVKQVAKDLGYRPNYQAINFRQKKSQLVGLIIPEMGMFFFPDVVKAIEEIAKKNGHHLIVFQSNESLEKEKECVAICQNFGVDGLLVCLCRETKNLHHFDSLLQNNIPVVYFDKVLHAPNNATVVINDFKASFTAVTHLAKKHYQNIGGFFGNENLQITQLRKKGFIAGLKKYDLKYQEAHCFHANTLQEAQDKFLALLQEKNKPDAIFTMTDQILAGIIQVIHEEGLKIPDDMGVISISNGNFPYYLHPKITHIKHSGHFVGKNAADLLFDLIEAPDKVIHKQIELETYLVELDSC